MVSQQLSELNSESAGLSGHAPPVRLRPFGLQMRIVGSISLLYSAAERVIVTIRVLPSNAMDSAETP